MMDIMVATSMAEERARRYREYVEALEEERRKIQVFQRELPLSLHLVTQTIENCRQAMAAGLMTAGASGDPSELDEEETSTEGGPVLEEFIPIKRSCSSQADDDQEGNRRHHRPCQDDEKSSQGRHHDDDCYSTSKPKQQVESEKKPDWLRSVQLWSRQPDPQPAPMKEDDVAPRRPIVVEAKKPTGAFQPFNPQRRSPALAAAPPEIAPVAAAAAPSVPPASSSSETRGAEKGAAGVIADEKDGHTHRKARRCWSPELHRRFLDALQRLGGSHVGTPKQIRELMMVDGLTNDEVKSHLQKYRLHSRRPSPTSQSSAGSPTPQQVVFLGGIWVPPPEYAAEFATRVRHMRMRN